MAELDTTELIGIIHKLDAIDELRIPMQLLFDFASLHLCSALQLFCTCLIRKAFLISTFNGIAHIEIILRSQDHIIGDKREERYLLICHRELGHHFHTIALVF